MTVPKPDSNSLAQDLAQLNRLVDVSLALNSTLELRPLLRLIMDASTEITHAESASILLFDPKTGQLRFVATTDVPDAQDDLLNIPVPMESLAGQSFRENRVLVLDDVSRNDLPHRDNFNPAPVPGRITRSLLSLPLSYRDRSIGVLEVVNKREGTWTLSDRRNLTVLAAQASVAIENAGMVQQLQRAYRELDSLTSLKDDFIAIASHELRTPLSVIVGYASFMRDEAEGDACSHAEAVLNSALRMRSLIEDLTNLRYLKTGASDLVREPIPLAALFNIVMKDVQSLATVKGHDLQVDMPPMSLVIRVDVEKFTMAILNLVNNAIKFTPGGGTVSLGYERRPGSLWVIVRDTGIGIPRDQLGRVFQEFHQVEGHMTRRYGGMGIGLAITKGVVEAHGGRIWAESDGPNRGSTFTLSLPLTSPAL